MPEFEARAVPAITVDAKRHGDLAVAGALAIADAKLLARALQQCGDRDILVAGDSDEGGVRTVFQETTNKIGQQVAVAADRRIDTAGDAVIA